LRTQAISSSRHLDARTPLRFFGTNLLDRSYPTLKFEVGIVFRNHAREHARWTASARPVPVGIMRRGPAARLRRRRSVCQPDRRAVGLRPRRLRRSIEAGIRLPRGNVGRAWMFTTRHQAIASRVQRVGLPARALGARQVIDDRGGILCGDRRLVGGDHLMDDLFPHCLRQRRLGHQMVG
jgi:hypothetical protein